MTHPEDVSNQAKCVGAAAICTHSDDHPCRACHVTAWAVLEAVRVAEPMGRS